MLFYLGKGDIMKKHDYNNDVYYESIDEKILKEETILDDNSSSQSEKPEKTLDNFSGDPKMQEQEHLRAYYANNSDAERLASAVREERYARINRQSLVLALFGLFLSLLFGIGIFLSVPAWIQASVRLKQRKSQTLVWAKSLGILGTFLNAFVLFAFIIFLTV